MDIMGLKNTLKEIQSNTEHRISRLNLIKRTTSETEDKVIVIIQIIY